MTLKILAVGLMPVALSACGAATALPDASYLLAPAAAVAAVPSRTTGYVDPIQGYTARPVTDPSDWRDSNSSQRGQ